MNGGGTVLKAGRKGRELGVPTAVDWPENRRGKGRLCIAAADGEGPVLPSQRLASECVVSPVSSN